MTDLLQTAALAHDIRNILSPALLSAEMISSEKDDRLQRHTDRIFRAIDKTVALCQEAMSTSQDNQLSSSASLRTIVRDAIDLATPRTNQHVEVEAIVIGDDEVSINPNILCRMVFNLLRNAIDALPDEGGTVTVKAWTVDGSLKVSVIDNGPGIPGDILDRLFPSLFEDSEKKGRIGLGIPTTAAAAKHLKGQLILAATGQKGTHFRIEVPNSRQPK